MYTSIITPNTNYLAILAFHRVCMRAQIKRSVFNAASDRSVDLVIHSCDADHEFESDPLTHTLAKPLTF